MNALHALTGLDLIHALGALEADLREEEALLISMREWRDAADLVPTEERIAVKRARVERFHAAWTEVCITESRTAFSLQKEV